MVKWTDIHPDFTLEWQQEWESWTYTSSSKKVFSYGEVKEWITAGLTPQDADFAVFLKNNGYKPKDLILNRDILEGKRKELAEWKKWKDVHNNFNRKSEWELWKSHGFDYQTTKEWAKALGKNFKPENYWAFCVWLRDEKHLTAQEVLQKDNAKFLREKYKKLWKDVRPDFADYQKVWEKKGLTNQDAQEWIPVGFEPDDYYEIKQWKEADITSQEVKLWIQAGFELNDYWRVKEWKKYAFIPQEAKDWINAGLNKNDYEFATYLRWKDHQPSPNLDWEKLKKEFKTVQNYLDCFYPENIKKLGIRWKHLTGVLDLSNFANLKELHCSDNQLTELKINNLVNLTWLYCSNNKLTSLDLTNCNQLEIIWCNNNHLQDLKLPSVAEKITKIDIRNNSFPEQDLSQFSHLVNLERLEIGNNCFIGSLKPLHNLTKLEVLDISNTDIDHGLENLPDSIGLFSCWADLRKDAKCKKIYLELNPVLGTKKTVQEWKTANFGKIIKTKEEIIEEKDKKITQLKEQIQQLEQNNQQLSNWKQKHSQDIKVKNTSLTELAEQNIQLEEESAQLKIQIEAKEREIADNLNNQSLLEKFQKEKAELEAKLALKEQELVELKEKNAKLTKNCFFYLGVITQFKEKKEELSKLKSQLTKRVPTEEELDEFHDLQTEANILDSQLENIITSKDPLIIELETKLKIETSKEELTNKVSAWLTTSLKESLKVDDLGIKKLFLALRRETISNLWKCYSEFEKSINYGQHAKADALASVVNSIGNTTILNTATGGISGTAGKVAIISKNFWKKKSVAWYIKEFKKLLEEDNKNYYRLMNAVSKDEETGIGSPVNEVKLFDGDYRTYEVISVSKEKNNLTFAEMEEVINSLADNYKKMKLELEQVKQLQVEQQPQILHQPYGIPGSSKNNNT